ncbi:MAG: hypothetical protein R2710_15565 [Acidimicrobiales bacterium]
MPRPERWPHQAMVLLSPSCTSYDWYANYGERRRDFMRLVKERHDT